MKTPVTDEAVAEYARRIREGVPLGKLFPAKMSDCDFTDTQRLVIRQARLDKKTALKKQKASTLPAVPVEASAPKAITPKAIAPKANASATNGASETKTKGFNKLRRLLFLQSNRCFFCGEPLAEADASLEHLNPLSRGGERAEDNEVVCHASLNEVFGDIGLKHKFALILKTQGKFVCPKR